MKINIMDIENSTYKLFNLGKINIILGKNGCGKSTLLREVERFLSSNGHYGKIKYITPERGGDLTYDPGLYHSISQNPNSILGSRRANSLANFRQQSVAQLQVLETLVLREIEKNKALRSDLDYSFDSYFKRLNKLLDNIELRREPSGFKIYRRVNNEMLPETSISSGEAELISLGIEILVFEKECISERENVLLLDEPDVHLHPDLQARLSQFLRDIATNKKTNATIILATHSTALLGALEDYDNAHVEFMSNGQTDLNFRTISEEYRKILPVFGAHPLSNLFNQSPILLVEGDDDEWIWQQAIKSSNQILKIYPCSTDGKFLIA